MDAAAFEQVWGAFGDFHTYFAPLFGRRETRDHSRHYLQALLVPLDGRDTKQPPLPFNEAHFRVTTVQPDE